MPDAGGVCVGEGVELKNFVFGNLRPKGQGRARHRGLRQRHAVDASEDRAVASLVQRDPDLLQDEPESPLQDEGRGDRACEGDA